MEKTNTKSQIITCTNITICILFQILIVITNLLEYNQHYIYGIFLLLGTLLLFLFLKSRKIQLFSQKITESIYYFNLLLNYAFLIEIILINYHSKYQYIIPQMLFVEYYIKQSYKLLFVNNYFVYFKIVAHIYFFLRICIQGKYNVTLLALFILFLLAENTKIQSKNNKEQKIDVSQTIFNKKEKQNEQIYQVQEDILRLIPKGLIIMQSDKKVIYTNQLIHQILRIKTKEEIAEKLLNQKQINSLLEEDFEQKINKVGQLEDLVKKISQLFDKSKNLIQNHQKNQIRQNKNDNNNNMDTQKKSLFVDQSYLKKEFQEEQCIYIQENDIQNSFQLQKRLDQENLLLNNGNIQKNCTTMDKILNYIIDCTITRKQIVLEQIQDSSTNNLQNKQSFTEQLQNSLNEKDSIFIQQMIDQSFKVQTKYEDKTLNMHYILVDIFTNNSLKDFLIFIFIEEQWEEPLKKQIELSQKNKFKIFSCLSHELRTPLNCSISMLEIFKDVISEEFEEQIQQFLVPALYSNKLLMNQINDILDFVQIDSGKFKYVFQNFCILELLNDCSKLISIQAQMKKIKIKIHFEHENKQLELFSDPNRIRQILLNFLSNALKFTKNEGVITLGFQCITRFSNIYQIYVQDTGIGIKQENLEKIFNFCNKINYHQSEDEKMNSQGCGLGLIISNSIAKGLIQELNIENQQFCGGVQVESIYGQGSKFSFLVQDQKSGVSHLSEETKNRIMQQKIHNQKSLLGNGSVQSKGNQFQQISKINFSNQIIRQIDSTYERENSITSQSIQGEEPFNQQSLNFSQNVIKNKSRYFEQDKKFFEYQNQKMCSLECYIPTSNEDNFAKKSAKTKIFITELQQQGFTSYQRIDSQVKFESNLQNSMTDENDIKWQFEIIERIKKNNLESKKKCTCPQIVIVDDNQFNLYALQQMLSQYYFKISTFSDADSSICHIKQMKEGKCCLIPVLIFLDIDMPFKNGYQATEEIIRYYQSVKWNQLPVIIACTAFIGQEDRDQSIASGMNDFINKPILKSGLQQLLIQWQEQIL